MVRTTLRATEFTDLMGKPASMRYQTEIQVATDRYVCLQLPSFFPEGRATVTVTVELEGRPVAQAPAEDDDRHDVEWWDEFDEEIGSTA